MILSTKNLNSLQGKLSQLALSVECRLMLRTPEFPKTSRTQWLVHFLYLQKSVRSSSVKSALLVQDCTIFDATLTDAEEDECQCMWCLLSSAVAGPEVLAGITDTTVYTAPRLFFQHKFCLAWKLYHFKNISRRGS